MGYVDYLKQGFEILKLNRSAMSSAAKDEEATKWGILTVILAGVISGLILTAFTFGLGFVSIITTPIAYLIGLFVGIAILWIVSKIFGGTGEYMGLLRPLALASMLWILSIIPVIGFLAGIWGLVVAIFAVAETQNLSIGKAVATVIIPMIIIWVIALLIVGAALFALFGASAMAAT